MVVAVVEVLNHIYRKYSEVFRFTKKFCNDAKKGPLRHPQGRDLPHCPAYLCHHRHLGEWSAHDELDYKPAAAGKTGR